MVISDQSISLNWIEVLEHTVVNTSPLLDQALGQFFPVPKDASNESLET